MSNSKIVPIIGVGAVAAFLYYYWDSFKNLVATYKVNISSIKFNSRDTAQSFYLTAFFDVMLKFTNPSNFVGTVSAVNLNILLNNRKVATVNKSISIQIKAKDVTYIPISVGISTLNLYGNVTDAIQQLNNTKSLSFTVQGTVITSGGTIDVNETIRVV
jgi:hypothetical protein